MNFTRPVKIIRPVSVGDAQVDASNVPETDHPEWDAETIFAKGALVQVTAEGVHHYYEALADNIQNVYPPTDVSDPPKWLDRGATNRYAMFDDQVGTVTTNPELIEVTFRPGIINSMALYNLDAASVEAVMVDPVEGEVWQRSVDLVSHSGISDWYAWYTEPIVRRRDIGLFDLPPYADASLTLRISQPGGTAQCGMVVVGRKLSIGGPRYGLTLGILDFSRKDRDEWGRPVIVERAYSKTAAVDVWIRRGMVDVVHETLSAYRAKPLVYAIAEEEYASSLILGYYRGISIAINYPTYSIGSIEIEGMI